MSNYDVIIIGAGPGGIFAAYELVEKAPELKVAVFEAGNPLEKRKCPIDGKKIKSCVNCKTIQSNGLSKIQVLQPKSKIQFP